MNSINSCIIGFYFLISANIHAQFLGTPVGCIENEIHTTSFVFNKDTSQVRTFTSFQNGSDPLQAIFVLPVEPIALHPSFGSALDSIKSIAEEYGFKGNILFIEPSFNHQPWYINHPLDSTIQQATLLLEIFKELHGKINFELVYILGFSKSGWGAMHLLMNYPNIFNGIFIWDAPLLKTFSNQDYITNTFKDATTFNLFRLDKQLHKKHTRLKNKKIVIGGYNLWEKESRQFQQYLTLYKIPFLHLDSLNAEHSWNKDWMLPLLKAAGKLE